MCETGGEVDDSDLRELIFIQKIPINIYPCNSYSRDNWLCFREGTFSAQVSG